MAQWPAQQQNGQTQRPDGDAENDIGGPYTGEKAHPQVENMSFIERIDHFTWAWGTLPMATGGIALLLADQPHTFRGLRTIGVVVFIIDLVFFSLACIAITIRFIRRPRALKASLTHPTESLFFATFLLCLPSIIGSMQKYGVPYTGYWLVVVVRILFWIYVAATFVVAVAQYLQLFLGRKLTVQSMTPGWLLPIFPVMLSGTIASIIAPSQPPYQRLPILVAGLTMQGLGFWVSIVVYAIYLSRLILYGIPEFNLRPGLFISVGPPSFTGLALIGMANAIPTDYGYFAAHPEAAATLQTMATTVAIFIWSLSLWFFCISAISCLMAIPHLGFHLVWWAFIFPNVGFTIAVISIGTQLDSQGVLWVGSIMSILLVAMYIFVFIMMVRAILKGDILWPHKDEDKDE